MASPEQSERNSPEKTGSSSVSKKVSEIWKQMNEGVPNKRFNFVSKTSTSSPPTAKKSPNSVRFFFFFFFFSPALFLIVWDFQKFDPFSIHRTGKVILVLMMRRRRRITKLYKTKKRPFRLVARRRLSALLLPLLLLLETQPQPLLLLLAVAKLRSVKSFNLLCVC